MIQPEMFWWFFKATRILLNYLLVFQLFWSLRCSVSALEIWSVYFDPSLELIKSNDNRLIQQLIDVPFDDERYISEVNTYIDSEQNAQRILRMELSVCEEIFSGDSLNHHSFANESSFTDGRGTKFVCLQRLATIQLPNIANDTTVVRYPTGVALPFSKYKPDHTFQTLLLTIEYMDDYDTFNDYSGFDLHLIDRSEVDFEAGIMAVGSVPDFRFFIPPKLNHWSMKGVCMSSCLQNELTPEIKIAAILVSTNHEYLEELSVKISDCHQQKSGREIFSLGATIELLEEPMVNVRDDKIIVECDYSTSPNNTIRGGFGIEQENCMVWMHYYPKIPTDACLSSYSLATIMSLLDLNDINVTITRTNGLDMKIQNNSDFDQQDQSEEQQQQARATANELDSYLDQKDNNDQWNIDKLIRAKYSAMKGRLISQCAWNHLKMESSLRRRRRRRRRRR